MEVMWWAGYAGRAWSSLASLGLLAHCGDLTVVTPHPPETPDPCHLGVLWRFHYIGSGDEIIGHGRLNIISVPLLEAQGRGATHWAFLTLVPS